MKITTSTAFDRGERVFTVFALLLMTGALVTLLRAEAGASDDSFQGNLVMQAVMLSIYGLTFILLLARTDRTLRSLKAGGWLWLLVGLALISAFWSSVPELTLRRGVGLLGTTLFGVYLASRYSLKEQLQLLAWVLGITAFLSLIVVVIFPAYGIHHDDIHAGAWRGIYHHKNTLGRLMVLAALAFFLFWSWRRRWLYGLGLMLCLSLMLLSNSATALVSAAVMLLLWPVWRLLRWRYRMAIPFAIVITISSVSLATWLLAGVELEQATAAAGRSISLTGRVPLWDEVLTMIAQRPWLGYGYNSFWLGWNGPSALVWESVRWDPVHAHNGFLDLVLDLGVVGLGLFALSFIFSLPRAINAARWGADASALWPLYYLVFMLLYNMTESSILRQNNILWALYVATVLSLARLSNQIIVQKEQHNAR